MALLGRSYLVDSIRVEFRMPPRAETHSVPLFRRFEVAELLRDPLLRFAAPSDPGATSSPSPLLSGLFESLFGTLD